MNLIVLYYQTKYQFQLNFYPNPEQARIELGLNQAKRVSLEQTNQVQINNWFEIARNQNKTKLKWK